MAVIIDIMYDKRDIMDYIKIEASKSLIYHMVLLINLRTIVLTIISIIMLI